MCVSSWLKVKVVQYDEAPFCSTSIRQCSVMRCVVACLSRRGDFLFPFRLHATLSHSYYERSPSNSGLWNEIAPKVAISPLSPFREGWAQFGAEEGQIPKSGILVLWLFWNPSSDLNHLSLLHATLYRCFYECWPSNSGLRNEIKPKVTLSPH